jgi:LmbE family N-acetylglucosaminyl deacetylase
VSSSYTVLIELVVHLEIMNPKQSRLKILAFFAHPDDETIFLGGTLTFLAEKGAMVHYVCATRGEGGEMGDPPVCVRDDLGQVREAELRCAVRALGGASLLFAGYRDPEVGPGGELYPFTDSLVELSANLQQVITSINPQVILTHGAAGEYGHPAHIQAHQGLMLALSSIPDTSPAVYSPAYLSRDTGEFTPSPDFLLDITAWKEQKIRAVICHQSQHGLFLRHGAARAGKPVILPEIVRTREALCRIIPPGDRSASAGFEKLLSEITLTPNSTPAVKY